MTVFKLDSCYAKDAFIICNSQGRSKGMAIVTFQRLGDAAAAKAKYDGKFIDMSKEFAISSLLELFGRRGDSDAHSAVYQNGQLRLKLSQIMSRRHKLALRLQHRHF